jgi:hypothetical protein
MPRTYKAILRGDRVQWLGDAPDTNGGIPVEVIVVSDTDRRASPDDTEVRRRQVHEALEALAASNPFAEITDPIAWQREIRKDRPLPGRED